MFSHTATVIQSHQSSTHPPDILVAMHFVVFQAWQQKFSDFNIKALKLQQCSFMIPITANLCKAPDARFNQASQSQHEHTRLQTLESGIKEKQFSSRRNSVGEAESMRAEE